MSRWIAQRRKAILSALGTLAIAIQGVSSSGLNGSESAMAITAAITTAVVYIVENAPQDRP